MAKKKSTEEKLREGRLPIISHTSSWNQYAWLYVCSDTWWRTRAITGSCSTWSSGCWSTTVMTGWR